ncbi:hypothetical protein I7I50_04796 [Histoplasma capsulatum G186AR]|uniref:Uncharacterized protein n=1 Tax=Ajellomyces capsulatus TaxID=5037 RepID=A0A8H8CXZ0_AJECA|nr:hypothetical protein I7I52_05705 [Histoplasma capsulatum]QSS75609.1 hypothetical protein I7I50_04796 [Histoplasma capsulatum G186AR]
MSSHPERSPARKIVEQISQYGTCTTEAQASSSGLLSDLFDFLLFQPFSSLPINELIFLHHSVVCLLVENRQHLSIRLSKVS